jgi:RsiW-degrading membrane proteinase PrsW (M82 family)
VAVADFIEACSEMEAKADSKGTGELIETLLSRHAVIFLGVMAALSVVLGTGLGIRQKGSGKWLASFCIWMVRLLGVSVLLFIIIGFR